MNDGLASKLRVFFDLSNYSILCTIFRNSVAFTLVFFFNMKDSIPNIWTDVICFSVNILNDFMTKVPGIQICVISIGFRPRFNYKSSSSWFLFIDFGFCNLSNFKLNSIIHKSVISSSVQNIFLKLFLTVINFDGIQWCWNVNAFAQDKSP